MHVSPNAVSTRWLSPVTLSVIWRRGKGGSSASCRRSNPIEKSVGWFGQHGKWEDISLFTSSLCTGDKMTSRETSTAGCLRYSGRWRGRPLSVGYPEKSLCLLELKITDRLLGHALSILGHHFLLLNGEYFKGIFGGNTFLRKYSPSRAASIFPKMPPASRILPPVPPP